MCRPEKGDNNNGSGFREREEFRVNGFVAHGHRSFVSAVTANPIDPV
jgi:hypothetical protein